MSGWNSKPSYPPDAFLKVPVRATEGQKAKWSTRRRSTAWRRRVRCWRGATDLYIALHRAWEDAVQEHEGSLHGIAGADRRRGEREKARREGES